MAISKIDKESHEHPSQSKSSFYPEDVYLRRHGYRIHSRPKKGEAVWINREGELLVHSEAIRKCRNSFPSTK